MLCRGQIMFLAGGSRRSPLLTSVLSAFSRVMPTLVLCMQNRKTKTSNLSARASLSPVSLRLHLMASSKSKAAPPAVPKAVPTASSKTPSLAERFSRLQEPNSQLTDVQLRALDMTTFGGFVVTFGKTVRGQTFQSVVEGNPAWTRWVLEHLADSNKREHQVFMLYVERYLDEAETTESLLLHGASEASHPEGSQEPADQTQGAMDAELWDVVASRHGSVQNQVLELSDRMSQMEGLVQQMLGAIQQLTSGQK